MERLIGSHSPVEEVDMSEGINTDKVIVNAGGGDRGSGLDAAAMIAALGNRNEGSDNAALIAALGNRNDDSNSWGPMMAMMANRGPGYGYDGGGFGGMNGILGIAALGLIFGRGRGGLFGGGDDGGGCGAETRLQSNADTLALLNAVGNAKDATTGGFATTALALSQGFANTKDAVQSLALFQTQQLNNINQNVSEQACKTREVVQAGTTAVLQALSANRIQELEDQVRQLHGHEHVRDSEIRVTQNVNQAQAQAQQQQQFEARFGRLENLLANVIQVQHATNQNIIAGNSGAVATGPQTANPTNVNTRS